MAERGFNLKIDETIVEDLNILLTAKLMRLVGRAAKSAMNRSLSKTNTQAVKITKLSLYKLKSSQLKKAFLRKSNVRITDLEKLEAKLGSRIQGPTMIRFVKGQKDPRPQRGIPVKKRKLVRVEIRPGITRKMPHSFIQKGRGGVNQVFRRETDKRNPIAVQRLPRLGIALFEDRPKRQNLEQTFFKTFDDRFRPTLDALLAKQKQR